MNQELERLAKQEWYTQGIAGWPGILTPFASIKAMQQGLGFSYSTILGIYKDGYVNWKYPVKDLKEHAGIILGNISKNPNYLKGKRQQYKKEVESIEGILKEAENIESKSEGEFFEFAPRLQSAVEVTVGTAHLLESISLRLEEDIRRVLGRKTRGKELNYDFAVITSPTTRSFISEKEEALWGINIAKTNEKKKLAQKFISDFFWVESSYAGRKQLTIESVLKEASLMEGFRKPDFEELQDKKKQLFEKYRLSEKEKQLVSLTEFLIDWQDYRKEKILKGVFALDEVFHEVNKRYGIPLEKAHQLLLEELPKALKEKTAEKTAMQRILGAVLVVKAEGVDIFTGKEFQEFENTINKETKKIELIMGSSASLGTATGPAKVCNTLESLDKIRAGDILVTSMTRPEYVSAMKKAAAIVTDEGGVLCHAAILSRELGIPCVVGTEIATKVLKDNDLIEVRANHGMVRKIR